MVKVVLMEAYKWLIVGIEMGWYLLAAELIETSSTKLVEGRGN
jgi:hypothetical protein